MCRFSEYERRVGGCAGDRGARVGYRRGPRLPLTARNTTLPAWIITLCVVLAGRAALV